MTYYIKDEVVTIGYREQFIAFTAYTLKNKKRFNGFVDELRTSRSPKFNSLDSLFSLARKYDLIAVGGFDPRPQARRRVNSC